MCHVMQVPLSLDIGEEAQITFGADGCIVFGCTVQFHMRCERLSPIAGLREQMDEAA